MGGREKGEEGGREEEAEAGSKTKERPASV
jgi:hypothetical protein